MKKIIAMLLALIVLGTLCAACGGESGQTPDVTTPTGEAPYRIKVVDALGNPCTEGIIVRFMQNGQQASMQTVGADGVASKELPAGDYTVELKFTDAQAAFYYDTAALKLTSANREAEIVLYNGVKTENGRTIFAQGKETVAYDVTVGCTYVQLTAGQRN